MLIETINPVIASISDPEIYEENNFINSKFIEIKNNDIIDVKMQYVKLRMINAEHRCMMREEVYIKLLEAAKNLPAGLRFRIYDAWRPFKLQQELYDKYSENIIKEFRLEKKSEEIKQEYIYKFVSKPVNNINIPPVHTTGGAIDLTLIDINNNELDMGTKFDAFTDKTYTDYYEQYSDIIIRNNRRILYNAMISAGFTNLPSEWWHYDYGDRFWAYYNKKPAIYKGIFEQKYIEL